MDGRAEEQSASVRRAQQAEEFPASWRWVEPCVWTIRMVTALEEGVEGGKWFRLFDKVFSERNLLAAFQKVARKKGAAGVDHVTTRDFERRLPGVIQELSTMLKDGTYVPQAFRRVHIPMPGTTETRPLGLSRSARPSAGRARVRDGSLCRRLRDPLKGGRRSRSGAGDRQAVGCRQRPRTASDEDSDRRLPYGPLRLLGLHLPRRESLATREEPEESPRRHTVAHSTNDGR